MEELSRTHKDVPFGWVSALQHVLSRGATHRVDQKTAPWRLDEAKREQQTASDLHLVSLR